jgi:hypothetical protein
LFFISLFFFSSSLLMVTNPTTLCGLLQLSYHQHDPLVDWICPLYTA